MPTKDRNSQETGELVELISSEAEASSEISVDENVEAHQASPAERMDSTHMTAMGPVKTQEIKLASSTQENPDHGLNLRFRKNLDALHRDAVSAEHAKQSDVPGEQLQSNHQSELQAVPPAKLHERPLDEQLLNIELPQHTPSLKSEQGNSSESAPVSAQIHEVPVSSSEAAGSSERPTSTPTSPETQPPNPIEAPNSHDHIGHQGESEAEHAANHLAEIEELDNHGHLAGTAEVVAKAQAMDASKFKPDDADFGQQLTIELHQGRQREQGSLKETA